MEIKDAEKYFIRNKEGKYLSFTFGVYWFQDISDAEWLDDFDEAKKKWAEIESEQDAKIIRFTVSFYEEGEETEETYRKREEEENRKTEIFLEKQRKKYATGSP